MAGMVKIALRMKNDVPIRTIEELRENFDLAKATEYFLDGRLLKWLDGRYYEEEAEKVRNLNKDDEKFAKKLCAVLGVEYPEDEEVDVKEADILNEKLRKLRQRTDDEEILSHAAQVAFSQEDLADLLEDRDETTIYLCGEKFSIPARFESRKYIGILGKPEIKMAIKTFEELKAHDITFENVTLPKNLSAPPAPPVLKEIIQGHAVIRDTAKYKDDSVYNGSHSVTMSTGYFLVFILDGEITLDSRIRIFRNKQVVYNGGVFALVDKDYTGDHFVNKLPEGNARIHFDKIPALQIDDVVEAYTLQTSADENS